MGPRCKKVVHILFFFLKRKSEVTSFVTFSWNMEALGGADRPMFTSNWEKRMIG